MKIINREFTCGCCEKKIISKQIMSYRVVNPQLDGKSTGINIPTGLIECPYCHYVNTKIEKKVTDSEKAIIESKDYQDLMSGEDSSAIYKAALLLKKDSSVRITILRRYVWHLSDTYGIHAEETKTVRSQYIKELEDYIQKEPNLEDIMLYIDALRLNEESNKLSNYLEQISKDLKELKKKYDTIEYKRFTLFINFESKLLNQKDYEIHYKSEIKI